MKTIVSIVAIATAAAALAGAPANDWENLEVNSRNRLPARAYSMPLANEEAAFTDALEPETPYRKSLNGEWRIKWVGDPSRRPQGFQAPDYDDSCWSVIDVPSCVEMRGFGVPVYTNVRYPHKNAWPKILDRESGRPDNNPVSSYRTAFTVPGDWEGRDVILRFDGVASAYYVWVNGVEIGYSEDSKLPGEFDITAALRPGGKNVLAVQVFKWCDGSYLEDQDMFRFSGIFRDVTLWAKPKDGIWDFAVRADVAAHGDGVVGELSVDGIEGEWSATLYDAQRRQVAALSSASPRQTLPGQGEEPLKLWSAEHPYLYTLVIRKGEDVRARKVGFKSQRIEGNRFLVNGKPVKLKGVNRHETSPENGRAVTVGDMFRDIELFKRYNINTVRTSHYPDHHLWYDLCDKYGIYVVAEANVEAHEPGYGANGLGRFEEWKRPIVERNERHVVFYRDHPCVTIWSLGNETGHGTCFEAARDAVKAADPTRPVHWERGNAVADIDSSMYPAVEWLEKRGRLGNATAGELASEAGGDGYAIAGQTAGKPYLMCEFAHAMGNALGNFQEYIDVVYAYPALVGGCIWDWIDQALWKTDSHGRRFLAYGGDYDDEPNDGPFCVNGVVDATRSVTPKLLEVAHVYRNLVVRMADGADAAGYRFTLENRFCFTDAADFAGSWKLLEDGVAVAAGEFETPSVPPLASAEFSVKELDEALAKSDPAKERFVSFAFRTRSAQGLVPQDWCVARDQLALPRADAPDAADAAPGADADGEGLFVDIDETSVTMQRGRTTAIFSRRTGALTFLSMRGARLLEDEVEGAIAGPHLTCARAFTDNDGWMRDGFYKSGLSQLAYHAEKVEAATNGVRIVTDVSGSRGCGFTHDALWKIAPDGTIEVENRVVPYGAVPELPRLGLSLRLPGQYRNMKWYGRGPNENYIDRCTASFMGVWSSTVERQFVDYARPQENGGKCDVRWLQFTDRNGAGVRFSASVPMFVRALHYDWEDLEFSRHRNSQKRWRTPLVPHPEICLDLDVRQTGLGGASCGPRPMDKYRFNPNLPVEWTLKIEAARLRTGN